MQKASILNPTCIFAISLVNSNPDPKPNPVCTLSLFLDRYFATGISELTVGNSMLSANLPTPEFTARVRL